MAAPFFLAENTTSSWSMVDQGRALPPGYGDGSLLLSDNTAATATADTLMTGGLLIGAFGAINSAIGSYYAAESQKNQLKSQAQNAKFSAQMSAINARGAEFSAQTSMDAAYKAIGRYTMGAGQARASAQTALAARGVQGGVGSAAEIIGSMDLIKEVDRLSMNANAVRQAQAYRTQAMNYATQSRMEGLSAQNLNTSAGSISGGLAGFGSLLGGTAEVGSWWLRTQRANMMTRS